MDSAEMTLNLQEIMARMSSIQAELTDLKTKANRLSQPGSARPLNPVIITTQRKTLRQLGLAILGGAATAATLGVATSAEARVIANPSDFLTVLECSHCRRVRLTQLGHSLMAISV